MTYIFTCPKCHINETINQPMKDDLPTNKKCPKCGSIMFHNIGEELRSVAIIIPEYMTAEETNKPQIKFDKSPSRKKHYF